MTEKLRKKKTHTEKRVHLKEQVEKMPIRDLEAAVAYLEFLRSRKKGGKRHV